MRQTLLRMRLPLALFVITLLVLCVISAAIFYSVLIAHSHGNYLRFETDYLEVDVPKDWFIIFGDQKNFSGTVHMIAIYPSNVRACMIIRIFDENATKGYLEQNKIGNVSSVIIIELERLYGWVLERNENATFFFVENGTMKILNHTAEYSTIVIEGYVDNEGRYYNNCTWTFISFIDNKLFQVVYLGIEKDYETAQNVFQEILNVGIRLKEKVTSTDFEA